MYEYDFGKFKKSDDVKVHNSHLASTPAKVDIFSQFEELDDINNNYGDVSVIEQTFEEPIEAYCDATNELEENLNKTMEIDTISDTVLENFDKVINSTDVFDDEDVKENKEPMSITTAFINCSVLGFITMFFGYGMFFYIMSHI